MARAPDPNLALLVRVAEALVELRSRFVFVGGCATGLLITDPAAPAARPTRDVDVIVEVGALAEYREVGSELQAKGFSQPLAAGDPPYRWTERGRAHGRAVARDLRRGSVSSHDGTGESPVPGSPRLVFSEP